MKKAICIILLICFCVALVLPNYAVYAEAASAASVKKLEDELADLDKRKKEAEKEYESLKNQSKDQTAIKESLDREIDILENKISKTNDIISSLSSQIGTKETQANKIQDQIYEKYDVFKLRIRASYEEGPVSTLGVFLEADSFSDMLTRMDIIQNLLEYDNRFIKSLRDDRNEILLVKAEIEADKASQVTYRNNLKASEAELDEKLDQSEKLIKELNTSANKTKEEIKEIEAAEDKIENEIEKQLKELSKKGGDYVGGEFTWPIPGYTKISCPYGMRVHPITGVYKLHTGTDIGAPRGTAIVAMNSGTVVTSKFNSAYGNYIIIDHGGGRATLYAHMMSLSPFGVGDKVQKGQKIGGVGSTGYSTGNHLHFEVRINGSTVNPMNYFS